MMSRSLFLLLSAVFIGIAAAEDLSDCGSQRYYPSQYTCYEDNFLCPVISGEPLQKCGGACYSRYINTCEEGRLDLLPPYEGPLTLIAWNPTAPFHEQSIEACGRSFLIGDGPCTYCPTVVPREACPAGNTTVLFPGQGLNVMVPGGQRYYVAPDGALGFTQAHSASYPVGSMFGVSAYQDGAFTYGGRAWVACPEDAGSGFKVFAQLPGLSFSEDCIPFTALVKSAPRGTFGAWQYT